MVLSCHPGQLCIPSLSMCRMLFRPLQAGMGSSSSRTFLLLPTVPAASPQRCQGECASMWLLQQLAQQGPVH